MSISTTLNNALSGLSVASRLAENVSSNIANAMTEGYGRREVALGQHVLDGAGGGVKVAGTIRHVDPVLLGNRRLAEASLGQVSVGADFLQTMESAIGLPDNPSSLTGRMTEFNSALIEAASRPDSAARLQAVVNTAQSVSQHLNTVSDEIQQQRMQADQQIGNAVDFINTSLQQIHDLNTEITRTYGSPRDHSTLQDERQRLIDGISEYIPIKEIPRDRGQVALFTPGGAILLDGNPVKLGFTQTGVITPDMNVTTVLSGLTINGRPTSTSGTEGPIAGGRLGALFDIRDVEAPGLQTRIDAVARDLIERFEDPSVDTTLAVGDPGLFTDAGGPFVLADELGLAGRISVNALVDPAAGGALWRIRDGLGALAPGSAGDATLLNALSDTLSANRVPASGGFIVAHSAVGISGDVLSGVSAALLSNETEQSYVRANAETLIGMELSDGVDTDAEMQQLLLVEQAFAANARVVATVDELIQSLIRM